MSSKQEDDGWSGQYTAAKNDAAFIAWLTTYLPDWGLEYRGGIVGLHAAFLAGQAASIKKTP